MTAENGDIEIRIVNDQGGIAEQVPDVVGYGLGEEVENPNLGPGVMVKSRIAFRRGSFA